MKEVWLPVPGYDGYMVSDRGRVRSIDRVVDMGRCKANRIGKVLKQFVLNHGDYLIVQLSRKSFTVHGLVALAFIGPRPAGHHVAHNNGKKNDNRLVNLRYATAKENCHDAVEHGTRKSRLTKEQVLDIRALSRTVSQSKLAERYGITQPAISLIVNNHNWTWL